MSSKFNYFAPNKIASNFSVQRLQNSLENRAGQSLATITTEKPCFGVIATIFAISVLLSVFGKFV